MRLKVTAPLESRDGTLDKGGLMQNCFAEIDGDVIRAKKRPALISVDTSTENCAVFAGVNVPDTSTVMLIGDFGGVKYSIDTTFGTVGTFSAIPGYDSSNGSDDFFFSIGTKNANVVPYIVKNADQAWFGNGTSLTPALISDIDYPGKRRVSVTSITRAGSTATVTTSSAHGFPTNSSAEISGATQPEYNGTFTITVTGTTTFTYTVSGTPVTPATGTITTWGGKSTVPGCVHLDGYWFVMDREGTIYNSDLENPSSWNSLNFIGTENTPDGGMGIARYQNYIVGFGSSSMEFFYDAANTSGSPLARVPNAAQSIGCADGNSIVEITGGIAFVGRGAGSVSCGVYALTSGFAPQKISTPAVDKLISKYFVVNNATTAAYGNYVSVDGKSIYILTIALARDADSSTTQLTIAYDFVSQSWATWKQRTSNKASVTFSSITQSNGVATCTLSASWTGNFSGNVVEISGATPSGYNGRHYITKTSDTTFTFPVDSSLSSPATGATLYRFSLTDALYMSPMTVIPTQNTGGAEGIPGEYLAFIPCEYTNVEMFALFSSFGTVYDEDRGARPIDVVLRTTQLDNGSFARKVVKSAEIIGDKVSNSTAIVRWTDDDYQTYSNYRYVDLSKERSKIHRLGSTSRRAYEIRHSLNTPFRIEALDVE